MLKWKLALTTLPYSLVVLVLSFVRDQVLHLNALFAFPDIGPLISATAMILGFMILGVLFEYKDSEQMPGKIASELRAMGDFLLAGAAGMEKDAAAQAKQKYTALLAALEDYVVGRTHLEDACGAIRNMVLAPLPSEWSKPILDKLDVIRESLLHIDTTRRTSFIQSGYALMDSLIVFVCALLVFARMDNLLAQSIVVVFVSFVYIYMDRLIRDLDNPFEYRLDGKPGGSAEVDLFALIEARRQLEADVLK